MKDPFISEGYCLNRLFNDAANQNGKLIIAFDFDNTVYDYHGKNYIFPTVDRLLRTAKEQGHTLICYTANEDEKFVYNYLKDNNIPFDFINNSPVGNGKKLYYNILLDDRAGLKSACNILTVFLNIPGGKLT